MDLSATKPCPLQARDLYKRYGTYPAVQSVSFQVRRGSCFALLGPNGAGKTTTCEILEGLILPDSGEVRIFERTYDTHRRWIQERIGVQLQETHMYKKYTVQETFELFASFYQTQSMSIRELMDMLGLTEKANARLEKLSGGQKQRVYLGCALVHNPELVFLDEPTGALDPQSRHLIWDVICHLKASEKSIVLTTHNMEEAQYLADHVAIMNYGQLIAQGSPIELIETHLLDHTPPKPSFHPKGTLEDVFLKLTGRNIRS